MAISIKENIINGLTDFWSRKLRSFITILGIILGTTSIMVVISLMQEVNRQSIAWLQERGGLSKITVRRNWEYESTEDVKNYFELKEFNLIRSLASEAQYFNPEIRRYYTFEYQDKKYSSSVRGVLPDFVGIEEWDVQDGRFFNMHDVNNDNSVIVIGTTIKEELFGSKDPIGKYISVNGIRCRIIGVMKHRFMKGNRFGGDNMLEYLNRRNFIPLSTLIHKFDKNARITSFGVKAYSTKDTKQLKEKLENIILNIRHGEPVFDIDSSEERAENISGDTKTFHLIFAVISSISLFVGGIVIMNIMLATVKERTREIGIRIAVGARKFDIFMQFLIQTIIVTFLGGVFGIILGLSIIGFVSDFLDMSLKIDTNNILIAIVVSTSLGFFFGIIPAVHASKLDPVKALRYE